MGDIEPPSSSKEPSVLDRIKATPEEDEQVKLVEESEEVADPVLEEYPDGLDEALEELDLIEEDNTD